MRKAELLLALGVIGMAQAQAQEKDPARTLGEVVVTATRDERTLTEVPASVTVVSREQIRATPGDSIDDVLRTVLGLEMTVMSAAQLHPTSSFPSMLGTKNAITSHVLVMVDGVPINDAYEGFVQWNRVPKENVERVEIVRGGGATLWGTYALGGVINIITRTPERPEVSAEAGAGRFGTYRADLYGTPVYSDRFKLSLSYNRFNTDSYNQVASGAATPGFFARPSGFFQRTSFNSQNLQAAAHFSLDASLTGLVRMTLHNNAQPQFVLVPMSTDQNIENLDAQLVKRLDAGAKLTFTAFRNDGVFRTFNASYNDNPGGIVTPADQGEPFLSNNHRAHTTDWGGSAVWTRRVSALIETLTMGVDLRQIEAREHVDSFTRVFGTPVSVPDPVNTGDFGGSQRFYGLFAQASVFPTSKLELSPSLRLQRWSNYDGVVLQAVAPGTPGAQGARSVDDLSARLSARLEASSTLALRAAIYKSFNAPTLDNLYRTFSANGFTIFSNPNLNPERLYGAEAGFDLAAGASKSSVLLFANTVHDYIAFAADAGGNFVNQNLGRTESAGLIASTDFPVSRGLSGHLGYGLTRARVVDSPGHPDWVGEQLAYVPRHKGDASMTFQQGKTRSSIILRYASKTYGVNGQQFNAINPGVPLTQGSFTQDAAILVDASYRYAFDKQHEAFVSVGNLFNRRYVANNDAFAPPLLGAPRTIFGGMRINL